MSNAAQISKLHQSILLYYSGKNQLCLEERNPATFHNPEIENRFGLLCSTAVCQGEREGKLVRFFFTLTRQQVFVTTTTPVGIFNTSGTLQTTKAHFKCNKLEFQLKHC